MRVCVCVCVSAGARLDDEAANCSNGIQSLQASKRIF